MKIDLFCHILPPRYFARMTAMSTRGAYMQKRVRGIPAMVNLDERFRMMDLFGDYVQVLSLAAPPIEAYAGADAAGMARLANDTMAETVASHPDRFPGFIASVAMNDVDGTLREIDRALGDLKAVGIQIFTNVNGRPLDDPAFAPIFERMARADRPIWLHPTRTAHFADYATEDKSKFELWWAFGWPYETSIAMSRIAFAGHYDRFPDLRVITHHMGGMIPYFAGRIGPGPDQLGVGTDGAGAAGERAPLHRRTLRHPQA